MKKKTGYFFLKFFIRAIIGMALIFIINKYVLPADSSINVGLNPMTFLTSGTLGIPGVCLLYSIRWYQFLWVFYKNIIFLILVWTKQKCPYIISLTNRKSSVVASVNWGITDVSFASKCWTFGTISLFRLYDRSKVSNYDNWAKSSKRNCWEFCDLWYTKELFRKSLNHLQMSQRFSSLIIRRLLIRNFLR